MVKVQMSNITKERVPKGPDICFSTKWAYGDVELAITTTEEPTSEYQNPYEKSHPCYRFADIVNHEFYSPAFPPDEAKTYPPNINCSVVITAPKNHLVELDFRDDFEIEKSDGCKNDFLEVRDGKYGYNDVLTHFCGVGVFPPKLQSTDRYLWVFFKSDENIEYKGFKAVFSFIPRANGSDLMECRKEISFEEQGFLGRDDIDTKIIKYDAEHGLPIDCMWVITVRANWRIQLQFEKFDLKAPNNCEVNFVEIFSNETTNSKQKFCGSIADTVLSETNHNVMIVRFFIEKLDNKSAETTFKANFTAFRDAEESDSDTYCKEDEFDCEDKTCISLTLKCNDKYNCRFRRDEDQCHSSEGWTLTDDHIIIIMVIFSLILTGMFFTFIYNCVKKLLRDHETIQAFKRSMEELDKENSEEKSSYKGNGNGRAPSADTRFGPSDSITTPCYVPSDGIMTIIPNNPHHHHRNQRQDSAKDSIYNQDIYTVDEESIPKMCDSACQTRESLFTTQEYSSTNTSPIHSMHVDSPQAPFSTFGYGNRKENKHKTEAKIDMHHRDKSLTPYDKRYSVQTTKSAPDVIVTH